MKRFRFGPGLLVTAAFIGPGTNRQPRRRWLWRDVLWAAAVRWPPRSSSRRWPRVGLGRQCRERQPADPGGRTRPDHHDRWGTRRSRSPDRGVRSPEPAFWATGDGARRRRAGRPVLTGTRQSRDALILVGHGIVASSAAHRPGHRVDPRLDPPPGAADCLGAQRRRSPTTCSSTPAPR